MEPPNANAGAIRVRPGDTLSGICARIYGVPPTKTRPHWGEFYRQSKEGALVPLTDPNRIQAGETLYHRPHGPQVAAGLTSNRPELGGRKVSEGVVNPKTYVMTDPVQLRKINALVLAAISRMQAVVRALNNIQSNVGLKDAFEEQFGQATSQNINTVRDNYTLMIMKAPTVQWKVQTERPVTATGADVYAFTDFGKSIAIWPANFYDQKVSDGQRVEIIIHELAHYSFDAGHTFGDGVDGVAISLSRSGLASGADTYEEFAKLVK